MRKVLVLLTSVLMLQGCAVAVITGAAVGGAASFNDRRTAGAQLDDQSIELKISSAISEHSGLSDHTHISATSLNRNVLLVGQVPNEHLRDEAIKLVKQVEGVNNIHNQLRIANNTSLMTRSNDTWLTTSVKTQLIADEKIPASSIKVITENAEVFLMGLVTREEAELAVNAARNTGGVNKVYKAFEYIN